MEGAFDFTDVLDEAVGRSGGERSTADDVLKVRRGMRLLLERWAAEGYNTWRIRSTSVMTLGGAQVGLPAEVDDVIDVNSVRGSGSEAPMQRITATQYAQLANKLTDGEPSQYFLRRDVEAPQLFIYPTGASTLTVWYVQRPADFERYSNSTDDVPGRWLEALVTGLALDLARKRPPYDEGLIQRLKAEAMEAEALAQRNDRDRTRFRYRPTRRRSG